MQSSCDGSTVVPCFLDLLQC